MSIKKHTDADAGGYIDFWSQRKPESFLLDVWVRKLAGAIKQFSTNERRLNSYDVHNMDIILWKSSTSAPIHGVCPDDMRIVKSQMRLIHKHEKRGTSLAAVSAIIGRLQEVRALFAEGHATKNLDFIVDGEHRLREPLNIESFEAYDGHRWLADCRSAQDVAATVWTNYFNRFLNETCKTESAMGVVSNLARVSPRGTEPSFASDMPLGALEAPNNLSFHDVIAQATACIPPEEKRFSEDGEPADGVVKTFVKNAQSFVDNFAPNLYNQLNPS